MSTPADAPPRNVLIQLFILGQLAAQPMAREFGRDGIDRSDFAVLTVIDAYGPITPTELSTKLGLPPTTFTAKVRTGGAPADSRSRPARSGWARTSALRSSGPASNKVTRVEVGADAPAWLAAKGDVVWVASVSTGTAHRIDPATNTVVATVRVGLQPVDGAIATDGTVWIPNRGSNTASLIDGTTNRLRGTVKVGTRPFVISEAFGHMWVPSWGGTDVRRFRP